MGRSSSHLFVGLELRRSDPEVCSFCFGKHGLKRERQAAPAFGIFIQISGIGIAEELSMPALARGKEPLILKHRAGKYGGSFFRLLRQFPGLEIGFLDFLEISCCLL